MSERSQGPNWWQAADGKWYPPDQPPAPGWWRASDGNWYPPQDPATTGSTPEDPAIGSTSEAAEPVVPTAAAGPTDATAAPGPAPTTADPAGAPPSIVAPGGTAEPASPSGATGGRGKGPLVLVGVLVVLVLLAVGGIFIARRGSGDGSVAAGTSDASTAGGGGSGRESGGAGGGSDAGGSSGGASDDGPRSDIKLASDVIVVKGNGGKAIKSFSSDGETIVLDPAADGIDKLSQGKVLLLTGVTAARVKTLEKTGDGITITTDPVTLPEVVQDGDLTWDNQVSADQGKFHLLEPASGSSGGGAGSGSGGGSGGSGDSGDTGGDPSGGDGPDINGPLGGASARLPAPTVPVGETAAATEVPTFVATRVADVGGKTISGKVGPMAAEITYAPNGNGADLHVKLTSTAEVSGTIDLDVKIHSLNNTGHAKVEGGTTKEFSFDMADLSGSAVVQTDLKSLQNVAKIKVPPFFKLPFSVDFPAPVGGIPFTLSLGGSIQVDLAMALAQADLSGRAEISFSGDAGFDFRGGSVALNGKRVQDAPDLLDSVTKLASGPVGVVATAELPKVGFGFSFLQTGAEVYISNGMVASQTVLPSPRQCVAMNVAYVLAGGVEAKFLGKGIEIARKPFVKKEWNYQAPSGTSCNAPK